MSSADKRRDRDESSATSPDVPAEGAVTLSRRTLLAAGVGLAASACAPSTSPEREAQLGEAAADPMVRAIRANRKVLGRVPDPPRVAADGTLDAIIPSDFPQPSPMPAIEAQGEKTILLHVHYRNMDIAKRDGTIVRGRVRAYNDRTPGQPIYCDAGDKLNITLRNLLPQEDFTYDYQGCRTVDGNLGPAEAGLPHAFNTTNLHTHGLHVSPKSICGDRVCGPPPYQQPPTLASDDIFVEVPPGGRQRYCIVLPEFHAPGTHWYHAHKHGSTSVQVNNGLAGALIVRERGEDRILGEQAFEDRIFLMQEIMEVDGGNDQLVYAQARGDSSKFFINGRYQPLMPMTIGVIQRWRFINGTSRPRGLTKLRLSKVPPGGLPPDTSDLELSSVRGAGLQDSAQAQADPRLLERVSNFDRVTRDNARPMYLIAIDGISRYGKPPEEVLDWDFAPGNRADFLARIDEPGLYAVSKLPHDYGGANPEVQVLFHIWVTPGFGEPMRMPQLIPGVPPCYLEPIRQVDRQKTVDFQADSAQNWGNVCQNEAPWTCSGSDVTCNGDTRSCNPPSHPALLPRIFAMDCARFDGNKVEDKYKMELNAVEEWTIRSFGSGLGGGAHPFHIHVNPFQVVEIFNPRSGETTRYDPDQAPWQDTVAIPRPQGSTPGHVKIRQRFLTYPGDFVIHCHFLNHEDLGMMKRVQVVPGRGSPGHPPCRAVQECSLG